MIIACVVADALSAALSMTFSSKEALASRWYVVLACVLQAVSMVTVGVSVGLLTRKTYGIDQPQCCAKIAWWGTISACDGPSTTFWVYYALRVVTAAQSASTALRLTQAFDQLKKTRSVARGLNAPKNAFLDFEALPATAHTDFLRYLAHPILLFVSLKLYLDDVGPAETASIIQYGQAIAWLVCASGLLHWAFLLGRTCYMLWKVKLQGPNTLIPLDELRSMTQLGNLTHALHPMRRCALPELMWEATEKTLAPLLEPPAAPLKHPSV